MVGKCITSLTLLLAVLTAGSGCIDTSERSQPQESALVAREEAGPPSEGARVPDDAEMQAILRTQRAIMASPDLDSLRRVLVRRAVDTASRVIWTVGTGRVTAPASPMALSNAERAAWIDGSRWAGYVIEWQKNDFRTPFGTIQTQVPGSSVERKSVSDSLCVVLVKTNLP